MSRFCVQATWSDVPHLTDEQKRAYWDAIPEHQRDARTKGIPVLGSGRVFPISEDLIKTPQIAIPEDWTVIIGVDFGWDHPFAAVQVAHNRDDDIVYVTKTYRMREATVAVHAAALRPWGDWIPVAWPHDGLKRDGAKSGEALKELYAADGLNMLPERATHEVGGNSVETGIMDMMDRMETGRLKVFAHLEDWFGEFRLYHREKGIIVPIRDDLLCATRYALMMLRFAATKPRKKTGNHAPVNWMG